MSNIVDEPDSHCITVDDKTRALRDVATMPIVSVVTHDKYVYTLSGSVKSDNHFAGYISKRRVDETHSRATYTDQSDCSTENFWIERKVENGSVVFDVVHVDMGTARGKGLCRKFLAAVLRKAIDEMGEPTLISIHMVTKFPMPACRCYVNSLKDLGWRLKEVPQRKSKNVMAMVFMRNDTASHMFVTSSFIDSICGSKERRSPRKDGSSGTRRRFE